MEVTKVFHKQSHKRKKCCVNDSESDSNSDYSSWSRRPDSTGELDMCKKCKLNITVNDYTYPSPNKAIQHNKKIVTNNHDVSNNITHVSNDNINMKTTNTNTKNKPGVTALIAIMEPVTESQSSRA